MSENASLAQRASKVLVGHYRPQPITVVRGEGCHLFDADGRRYLDLMGGIATAVVGHCHPKVVAALEEQSHRLWHVSNLYGTEPQVELAERLPRKAEVSLRHAVGALPSITPIGMAALLPGASSSFGVVEPATSMFGF